MDYYGVASLVVRSLSLNVGGDIGAWLMPECSAASTWGNTFLTHGSIGTFDMKSILKSHCLPVLFNCQTMIFDLKDAFPGGSLSHRMSVYVPSRIFPIPP